MFNLKKKSFKKFDFLLLFSVIALCIYGLIMIKSATLSFESSKQVKTQAISTILGLFVILILILLDYEVLSKLYIPIYVVCNLLLIVVLFKGVGDEQWGARSWLYIGKFGFQPAEFVKVGLIISLAKFIDINKERINEPFTLLKVLAFAFLPVLLILKQPDAGTAIVFVFFIAIMLFAADVKWKYIGMAIIAGVASLPILWFKLDEFQRNRIFNFLDPERDMSNTGYQAMQGKIAIGSGKVFGRGLFQGVYTQYNYIPEKQTDFIFAVIGEELGFLGGIVLILLYLIMLQRMIKIAKNSTDTFGSCMCIGIVAMFLFHIWENIGMTIGLMPITGIPLPFLSYGGTFQLVNMICIGIVLSVGLHREGLTFDK
ncbi:rod shape-determining protein RodA [Paratissierella segnis]|jgi:rod shape determining protein RodA|uniref:Peptidoglycan glycosyltransferase RodA n=1 Tax=Paratissierella segnis TaxID=2763679 RepID=A0A926EZK3_9FIRM|nr:rod shape-determining protein RodA [Paratissierella segnis]MBC8589194.1 rod shape-determining protein RodA [Paratissierella segnis]